MATLFLTRCEFLESQILHGLVVVADQQPNNPTDDLWLVTLPTDIVILFTHDVANTAHL